MAGKKLCVKLCFSSVSRYVLTPGQCYARQTSKGNFFGAGKVCFYVFMFEKLCLWTPSNKSNARTNRGSTTKVYFDQTEVK